MSDKVLEIGCQTLNIEAVEGALSQLAKVQQNRTVRQGLRKAANIFIRGGRRRLRERLLPNRVTSGNLMASFEPRLKRGKPGALAGFRRGVRGDRNGYHAHLVDRGTVRRYTKKGYYRGVMPMNFFWTDTYTEESPNAASALITSIEDAVNKIANGYG